MTKKLEDILNLPNVKEAFKEVDKKEKDKKIKKTANGNPSTKNLDPQTQKNLQMKLNLILAFIWMKILAEFLTIQ